ncbi:NAD-dependent dehydratase [Candidatus Beckwithbacteria bacterium CG10_big_fil_rev_8_21_14_0_10_34_10]|uniref:UDP-glucuronate decarboxylase n=1 Tax=Candidatus Beckwithbacteria bacterium CG10_big_fil_rev_8_21_14_0_10_34_10 TaxID=1974495 RepID=A0A2H0W952_9BACT|nr:MAG: NAD-dependent dehydratase [Candidatus Beckwithbacteria bacterium CG10_big_fil_rev_8_21_14_0_10_34_10]
MKKVLITGGAGFIGSHLSEEFLNLGYQVTCLDNFITGQKKNISRLAASPNFKLIKSDVSKKSTYELLDQPYSLILHFASPAGANPKSPLSYYKLPIKTYLVNSIGTHYLLKLAKKNKAEFIFASTSEVYGNPLEHPQKETYFGNTNPVGPRACYDESKRFGEMVTNTYGKKHQLNTKIVRIFNTYGPRMNPKDGRAIPLFITQALKNKPINIYGTGKQTRSFCYIADLVKGIVEVINLGKPGEIYNLGNPEEITINQMVEKIINLTNSESKVIYQKELEDDPQKRCPDISKAKKGLNWEPKVSLEKGLLKTIEYFRRENE